MRLLGRRGAEDAEQDETPPDTVESEHDSRDILSLLDELEHALTSASRVPLTGRLLVDEEAVYALLDDMRAAGQAGIRQARAIVRHREQVLEESAQEAARIVAEAEVQAQAVLSEPGLADRAARRGRDLLDEAERQAREVAAEADQYTADVLGRLRERLQRLQALTRGDEPEAQ